jgi:hypothetical protein
VELKNGKGGKGGQSGKHPQSGKGASLRPPPAVKYKPEHNYPLIWGLVTLLTVLLCIAAGVYTKRYLNREFIGEQTRILQQCRQDPSSNPKLCEELLIARGEIKQSPYAKTMRGPQRPPFLLYDSNADLTPVPH